MAEIIHTQEYDRWSFDPPMPVLDIGLSRPGGQTFSAAVAAVIDTGADGTLIPIDLLDLIDAPQVDRAYLRGITGDRQPVDLPLMSHQDPRQALRRKQADIDVWLQEGAYVGDRLGPIGLPQTGSNGQTPGGLI